ncbi:MULTISPECIES: hypothetical protein [Streptomyces]|uniref:Uncharacterized protein n=1 Tax=Streptomyces microflavus TaxID=1919 RepID=A0A6N9V0I6_STRMI|nr:MULTISPECIES: hypothetical protein [Streptomyces]MEE1728692.1 hypothetical protein [Streptomyces sp. BE282]NEB66193.1 hypothetical protein [Streptomyces microflavus]NEE47373.1 hypothetical protein [Streptomyces sp. SID8455]
MHGATRSPVNASVAAAAAGDVDVDAEAAAWQVQEGQGVVQAALDDLLEAGGGASVRLDVGARPVECSIRSRTTGSLGV